MNVYEAMATQRAVRRLRPDPIPGPVIERISKQRPGRQLAVMCNLFEW